MKHICVLFAFFAVFFSCSSPDPIEVQIPDANLAAAVRETLRLDPNESIRQKQLAKLKTLRVQGRVIKNLTGLEKAKGLKTLDLFQNRIEDITPLTGLSGLTTLKLSQNRIEDITPLAGLPRLKALYLSHNQKRHHTSHRINSIDMVTPQP